MTATSLNTRIKNAEPVLYKGYTIQPDYQGWYWRLMFYPTEEGVDHDADYDGESYSYTGNCQWCDSIQEAKLLIDEIVPFLVETHGPIPLGGHAQLHVTKFNWLSDAVRFASKFNGSLNVNFNSI